MEKEIFEKAVVPPINGQFKTYSDSASVSRFRHCGHRIRLSEMSTKPDQAQIIKRAVYGNQPICRRCDAYWFAADNETMDRHAG
jgi:hypothetical protein